MNLNEIEAQGFILTLFIRDDGERFLLGTGAYQFVQDQLHFTANSFANDVVEVQGNDGVYFAGQVRRANTQAFDGYIGDADTPREDIENYRRQFIAFFRKNYYYTVVYVFNNGSAIKRQKGFIVDAPEVKELYQIYPQYHIALNFEDVNYYQYNENDEGIEQFGKSALITLSSNSNTGGLIWQQGSGEPIIYGDTEQNQYSGKNLCNYATLAVYGSAVQKIQIDGRDGFRIVGLPSSGTVAVCNDSSFVFSPDTYTISFDIRKSSESDNIRFLGNAYIAGESATLYFYPTGESTANISPDTSWQRVYFNVTFTQNTTFNSHLHLYFSPYTGTIELSNLQIEKNSTPTDYEPYVGGVPAPSPDYPQPITNVTGDIELGVGKNLFGTTLEQGGITSIDGSEFDSAARIRTDGYINVNENNMYSYSAETSGLQVCVFYYQSDGTYLNFSDWKNLPASITTIENASKIKICYRKSSLGDITPSEVSNVQIELGSTVTDYEPYTGHLIQLGSIELCKIGTYQDYIYKDSNEDWYVHKAIDKITPNGTENWGSSQAFRYDLDISDAVLGSASNNPIISTHFMSRFATIDNSIFLSGVSPRIGIFDNNFGDLTSFKNWLGSNTVDIYYALGTSTDIKITDNTLIGQLNAWASSLTTTGGVEWDNIGAVWEIGGSGGPVNVTIDSIDNVYPIWEVTGPATNPEIEIIESNTSIKYTGSIGADEKLVVDMLNKTALVNGVSVIGNISGVWCYLKPSNNKVTYTTDNAGATPSKLLWQEVVG